MRVVALVAVVLLALSNAAVAAQNPPSGVAVVGNSMTNMFAMRAPPGKETAPAPTPAPSPAPAPAPPTGVVSMISNAIRNTVGALLPGGQCQHAALAICRRFGGGDACYARHNCKPGDETRTQAVTTTEGVQTPALNENCNYGGLTTCLAAGMGTECFTSANCNPGDENYRAPTSGTPPTNTEPAPTPAPTPAPSSPTSEQAPAEIPWSKKMGPELTAKVIEVANRLEIPNPGWLSACMAFESAYSFDPAMKNQAGSGATGLIQFMPATARGLGTSIAALERMTPVEQMEYVYKHFQPYSGKLKTIASVYMTILWPVAADKPDDYVIFKQGESAWAQNSGLDTNGDGKVTKKEAGAKIEKAYADGIGK